MLIKQNKTNIPSLVGADEKKTTVGEKKTINSTRAGTVRFAKFR